MLKYEKPIVLANDDLAEGIYLASGGSAGGGQAPETASCDSIYMNGIWHGSDFSDWQNGTNINGRGCEGCPANWGDGICHVANYDPSEDCRPSWEKNGKGPDEKWNQ